MKYNKKKLEQCARWVRENGLMEYGGAMLKDFCIAMDIDDDTFYAWMRNKAEFQEAIEKAKDDFRGSLEEKIVKSLAKSAQGFETEDVTTDLVNGADGKPVVKHQIRRKHFVPPNTGAAIFLLTNLNGEQWKNKQNSDVSLSAGDKFEELMKSLSEEENDVNVEE